MRLHPIKMAADKLPNSIWNTAREFKEGRDILIRCLSRNARRTELEVIDWLKDNDYIIKDLEKYKLDDTDRTE